MRLSSREIIRPAEDFMNQAEKFIRVWSRFPKTWAEIKDMSWLQEVTENSSFMDINKIMLMSASRRKFTDEEKLEILRQASQSGITEVLRKHNLSYSVFTRWKQKFIEQSFISGGAHFTSTEMKLLQEENSRLKRIIADQALALELKNEELRRLSSSSNK
jgi:putative transposase